MSCGNVQDFCVQAGETFHPTIRWALDTLVSAAVTGITQSAPVVITAPAHGMPDGWPCALVGVQGMSGINAANYPPRAGDWHKGSVLSASTVQLNAVSTADFPAYSAGGFLVYSKPAPLAGVSAVMNVWDTPDDSDTPLVTLTTANSGILLDPVLMTITPYLQTAGLAWKLGYYRLDVTDASGAVTQLAGGTITIQ